VEAIRLVTNAGLTFTGVGIARIALIAITFVWTGTRTTPAVWITSCNTNDNKKNWKRHVTTVNK